MKETEETGKSGKKENSINITCKKLFTPELCGEPITETKTALKNKLYAELLRYGNKVAQGFKNEIDEYEMEGEIIDAIGSCWVQWEKKTVSAYSVYFASALKNSLIKLGKKNRERQEKEISITKARSEDDPRTAEDSLEDKSERHEEKTNQKDEDDKQSRELLSGIGKYVQAARKDVRPRLEIMFTYRLLRKFDSKPEIWFVSQEESHGFISAELVKDYFAKLSSSNSRNEKDIYTQKDISRKFGIPEKTLTGLNKKIDSFLDSLAVSGQNS